MRARRIREPHILAIIDNGESKGKYRWCVVAFDVNDHQIPEIQGYDWEADEHVFENVIWLARTWLARTKR